MSDTPPHNSEKPVSNPGLSAGLITRVQSLLLKPAETWDIIAEETVTVRGLYTGYIMPLAAIGPLAHLLSATLIAGIFGPLVLLGALGWALVGYVLTLIMVYVLGFVINMLAPSFDGEQNPLQALKLAAYSSTAGWVASIFGLLPVLGLLALLGLIYGLYIMYLGLPKLMKSPAAKSPIYMIVIAVVMFIMWALLGVLTMGGMMGQGLGHLGYMAHPNIGSGMVTGGVVSGSIDLDKMKSGAEQLEAQASAMKNGTTAPIKVADPQALLALMPQTFQGGSLTDTNTSSGGAGGVSASTARGTYAVGGGSVTLEVSDIGSMAGLGAMATAINLNSSSSSAGGYEKVTSKDGILMSESYETAARSGKYAVISDGRISISASGTGVDMSTLKALVASVDTGRAKALTQ